MRGILIDPFAKTVTEIEVNYAKDGIHAIYAAIDANCFDVVRLNDEGDGVYVDDEGLYREDQAFFVLRGYESPLAGKGLILGCDQEGETRDALISLKDVRWMVEFPELEFVDMECFESIVDHPILGPNTPLIGSRPIFRRRA